ncbi:fungal-specific transcription factor domain-containing protein [Cadophora sp. MPI-SDFR-AT-0126]|nr:fungal-specific transcription factor domain-containing protein [Leotiomycetes sp. MPI-SDFR-AT-0126]
MASVRSHSGCWTCRIRKKKCDDLRPTCGPCSFRNITCHGYGDRPQFMHDPEEQRLELEKIQRAVSESLKARRSFRVSKRTARGFRSQSFAPNASEDATSNLTEVYQSQLSLEDGPRQQLSNNKANAITALPVRDPWPSSFTASGQPASQQTLANPSRSSIQPSLDSLPPILPSVQQQPVTNEKDLSVIMNYLDNIFPLQFYFYQPSASNRGRGWLLALILRSKSTYYTTLAFGTLTQIIFQYGGDSSTEPGLSKELDEYHTLAITELQQSLKRLSEASGNAELLRTGVEILACTVQLLSIEVFRETKYFKGWKSDWEFHLDAVGIVLWVIGNGLAQASTSLTLPIVSEDEISRFPDSSIGDIVGVNFYMTTYIWSDILRCACFGLRHPATHSFEYLSYLEDDRIRLDRLMGCKNWAMIAIRETTDLETWKIDMQTRGTLDISMLYRKGATIESRLTNGLNSLKQSANDRTYIDQMSDLVTEVYALSAHIHLSVVLWGNSPRTPLVRLTVASCLAAIEALPQHLIVRTAFPFCVAGCMASDEQKDSFRTILEGAEAAGYPLGMLWNSLDVMEEFWTMREKNPDTTPFTGNSGCPWAIAMDRMGTKSLLI